MKKQNKFILLFIPFLSGIMAGCGTNNVEPSNPSYIQEFIDKASISFTANIKGTDTIYKKDGSEIYSESYLQTLKLSYKDEKRVSDEFSINSNGETLTSKFQGVGDERGYLCEEALNYKNEIELKPVIRDNSKVRFDDRYFNPFTIISTQDLEKVDDDIYSLEKSKQPLLVSNLTSQTGSIEGVTFTFKEEQIHSIDITFAQEEGVFNDKNSGKYIPVDIGTNFKILLSELGTTKIAGIKPKESRNAEKEALLKKALNELGTNYTILINEHDRDSDPNPEYNSPWYFNGVDKVYHQQNQNDETGRYDLYYKTDKDTFGDELLRLYDRETAGGPWIYNKPTYPSSYNSNPQPYSYFTPKTQGIAPELFTFDAESNKFICDTKEVIGYLGNNLLPGCYKIKYFTQGQGDKCEITLTSDNKIKQITVGYSYLDPQGFELFTDYDMRFLNINKTKIPTWVEA